MYTVYTYICVYMYMHVMCISKTLDLEVHPLEAPFLHLGNARFAKGAPTQAVAHETLRQALVSSGQAPHSAVLGCADSRVPIDTIFDAMPGDIFNLRNAGNTCAADVC